MIQLTEITTKFGSLTIFDNLTICFDRGQINFLTGESGSEKLLCLTS